MGEFEEISNPSAWICYKRQARENRLLCSQRCS